ncbi:DUF58 domain-containing protein [Exiguobacterium sp. ZOR0005]|uniref:DUF58 domain-containing protein n=1 Tax=Exiguobacterium sp. ZOR0005 TaxID=1339226 RepID=UPI001E3F6BCC|nr:DUF58 domain-containing protein [Exiguobacterium sp. ZOR0005]
MRQVEVSTPSLLDEKLWPAYTGILVFFVWFPYVWPFAYVAGVILGLMLARKWLTKQIVEATGLSFHQKEQLLFVNDRVSLKMDVTGIERLETLGIPISVRLVTGRGLTFDEDQSVHTLQLRHESTYLLPIHAKQRGPVQIDECTLQFKLPFWLGTIFVTGFTLPSWIILPCITKQNRFDSRLVRMGDRLVKHSPLNDPLMMQSTKRYEQEPVKQIDWVATAKTGKLQAKVFQRQNLDTFTLALDLSGTLGNGLHARYEELIQQAAYLVAYLVKEDCKVELFINRLDADNQIDHLRMSDGRKQLRLALVRLAWIYESDRFVASKRFNQIIDRQKHPHAEVIRIDVSLMNRIAVG